MKPSDYLAAARVPRTLLPQTFGVWTIERRMLDGVLQHAMGGWKEYTLLTRPSMATIHLERGEIVMEDSRRELRKHLPIWLAAAGRVLVTGLGLGCVVRGLLASPRVDQIDVVEIDKSIIRVVGAEFAGNPRVTLHHADALTFEDPLEAGWDYAWHDLWTDGDEHLQRLHMRLFLRFSGQCKHQGAWAFPRWCARLMSQKAWTPLGAPNWRRAA